MFFPKQGKIFAKILKNLPEGLSINLINEGQPPVSVFMLSMSYPISYGTITLESLI